jgi:hypothetical protein
LCKKKRLGCQEKRQKHAKMIVQRVKSMRQTVCLLLLLAATDCIGAATAWGLDKIRIGMGAFSPTNSAIWVAEERGFFKTHGICKSLGAAKAICEWTRPPRPQSVPAISRGNPTVRS